MGLPRPALVDLGTYLAADRILTLPAGTTKDEALRQLSAACASHPAITDTEAFTKAIFERERVSSTGIGNGIAVPHAKLRSITDFVITVGLSEPGVEFAAKDGEPVHILVMIAASEQQREAYLRVLATVASVLKRDEVRAALRAATSPADALAALTS
ncbi:MAG: PTS sugar transporter subunit IIA [Planctomycetota bacterium]|jgi:mannitol/fructose-specific phosphotransferase system IIA component (Ntr-type)|nr:PTS sugar transporter subunit IIA [Planctomycetota bacterium]